MRAGLERVWMAAGKAARRVAFPAASGDVRHPASGMGPWLHQQGQRGNGAGHRIVDASGAIGCLAYAACLRKRRVDNPRKGWLTEAFCRPWRATAARDGEDAMHEYQVGDVIQCGTAIVRIHLIDGNRAWHHGIELGQSSHGGLVLGWCIRHGHWPILQRRGKAMSPETETLYQRAVELFPDKPWLGLPNVSDRLRHWLGPQV